MAENPRVHSKAATYHGKPRTPGHVATPAGPLEGGSKSVNHSSTHTTEGKNSSVSYDANEGGRMHGGEHAEHPTHGKPR